MPLFLGSPGQKKYCRVINWSERDSIDFVKYSIFFTFISIFFLYELSTVNGSARWLLIWPMLSSIVLGSAYLLNRPSWVCGKTGNGGVSISLTLLNLPWLVFAWIMLLVQMLFSNEDEINRIGESNLWISRYPVLMKTDMKFDLVIDLTSEFPGIKRHGSDYICLPNLDGISLANIDIPKQLNKGSKILVHCAQGHGRSAAYASRLYASLFAGVSAEDAYHLILRHRPGARVSKDQLQQIVSYV